MHDLRLQTEQQLREERQSCTKSIHACRDAYAARESKLREEMQELQLRDAARQNAVQKYTILLQEKDSTIKEQEKKLDLTNERISQARQALKEEAKNFLQVLPKVFLINCISHR